MDRSLSLVRIVGRITLKLTARLFLPLVWRVLVGVVKLVLLAQINFWKNVPGTIHQIVDEWWQEAIKQRIPSSVEGYVRPVGRVIAFLLLLAGWILNAFITVWIFQLIFG